MGERRGANSTCVQHCGQQQAFCTACLKTKGEELEGDSQTFKGADKQAEEMEEGKIERKAENQDKDFEADEGFAADKDFAATQQKLAAQISEV